MDNGTEASKGEGFLSRMALNDNKAGMEGLDRDRINKIIMETSKGSRFYENELKKEQQVNRRIEKVMLQKAQITEQQLKKAQAQVDGMASALERSRDLTRAIVHVDMDAFYAAVEMRDCPELKDKPMAVGSMSMLSTSNYHARKFGVRAAMPGFIAKKLCPNLIIVPLNSDKYRAVSDEIREIFADYDPHFQPMSLDEAYLDFTDHVEQRQSWPESSRTHPYHTLSTTGEEQLPQEPKPEDLSPLLFDDSPSSSLCSPSPDGVAVASPGAFEVFGTSVEEAVREMRFRIEQKTTLTASAGIAPNMMLAKVCSDTNKPNGQYRLPSTREAVMDFIQNLPVRKVSGIGKVSEKMLSALGVCSCSHFGQQMALLSLLFSESSWHHFLQVSLGLGSTYIPRHEERKSMSTERTFKEVNNSEEQLSLCRQLCEDLAEDLKKENHLKGKTVTLKLKNVNFEVKTRALTLPCAVATVEEIFAVAKDLLKTEIENESPQPLRLRLMGVRISAFVSSDDKTPLQRSIIGFLQPGGSTQATQEKAEKEQLRNVYIQKSNSSAHLASPQKFIKPDVAFPWRSKQNGAEGGQIVEKPQQQSFFKLAQAKRLQTQVNARVEEHKETLEESKSHTAVEASTNGVGSIAAGFSESAVDFDTEAVASTSNCEGTATEHLTCPVCFRQVETTDLNVFNTHIDQCLSGSSGKPNKMTDPDSESDLEPENEQEEFIVGRKWKERFEAKDSEETEMYWLDPQDQHTPKKDHSTQTLLLINDKMATSGKLLSGSETGPALICPVCQLTQDTDDLSVFNRHVDLCLNQEVIHELGGQTSSPIIPPSAADCKATGRLLSRETNKGKSKRQGSPHSPPSKKAKCLGPVNTIDRFFAATVMNAPASGRRDKGHHRK